ncbi:N-acetylmuramoyl-L-alanine amidase [Donghicola sp. C2-DW-16]|uniref:N-acetylmuramoyl-L-alanine amidase n=1 Tax=Donghicola mangrovi TaxID=2729614 RepID=A0ABX2PDF6_9RHOB|nr:N-acetylmuramoyl-L-alanine amidase [Donghicola mangrovi]NVO27166.1 N-acetylmuramoyl-L-alanine amidase [Donghicola mangrovi]
MSRSPNHGPRKGDVQPDMIVLHYTVLDLDGTLDRLCDPEYEVSAHYALCPTGGVFPLVDEGRRAWHAGLSNWGGEADVNSRSIGIEIVNDGASPFPVPQMDALAALLTQIRSRWDIPDHRIVGHSDVAPGRKVDPGRRFDWQGLSLRGHGVWPRPTGQEDACWHTFATALRDYGYTAQAEPEVLLDAFRMHFRPWGRGGLSGADVAAAVDLADRFAVDRTPDTQ